MRLYAMFCFAGAVFYCGLAIQIMRTGVATPMRGETSVEHRRDDPNSKYSRYLAARWMLAGGLAAVGVVMGALAGKFEKLEDKKPGA